MTIVQQPICRSVFVFLLGVLLEQSLAGAEESGISPDKGTFVRVSQRDPRYFELTDGKPYLAVGFNLVGPPDSNDVERVVMTMAENGVNYCRIWLDQSLWSVEQKQSGQYDGEKARELDRFLKLCRSHGIRVKMCIEWFRSIVARPPQPPARGSFPKPIHHVANGGFYTNMTDFLTSERGRTQFKGKLKWYADRYGSEPAVFAWELWNEMNAVQGPWYPWTQEMLPELHKLFPRNLCVQSLGSFDHDRGRDNYRKLCEIPDNDILQVHRYLDLGAALQVCHGPVDVLAADAVRELQAFGVKKPIILTETGAVKPRHTGASELYAKDKDGILLHDMLFAPFFAGAAGTGHVWFWREAIDRPGQWHHFKRFNRAVEGIDPRDEAFEAVMVEHPKLRIYILRGKKTAIAWCRDVTNDWKTEMDEGKSPESLKGIKVDLSAFKLPAGFKNAKTEIYDPWQDTWRPASYDDMKLTLPEFKRSLVVRIRSES